MELTVEQDEIDGHAELAREFLRDVFSMDMDKVLLTDSSDLADFFPSGMELSDHDIAVTPYPELVKRWDCWVVERIRQRYGIEAVYATMPLLDLFKAIEAHRRSPCLH